MSEKISKLCFLENFNEMFRNLPRFSRKRKDLENFERSRKKILRKDFDKFSRKILIQEFFEIFEVVRFCENFLYLLNEACILNDKQQLETQIGNT